MKKEVVSEAINKISEEYILEALELQNDPRVSEIEDMKSKNTTRKIFVVGLAASLTLALGATAYATGLFGMDSRDAAENETLKVTYNLADGENDGTEKIEVQYNDLLKLYTFSGPEECNEIEFKAKLPTDYSIEFGKNNTWTNFIQGVNSKGHGCTVDVYYAPQFGENGSLFLEGTKLISEDREENGVYEITKTVAIPAYDDGLTTYFYMMYNNDEGYLIVLSGTCNMDNLETVAKTIEVRKTDRKIKYDANADHDIYLGAGVG